MSTFRTITAVAEEMGVQQYVLRFWEGRFPSVIRPTRVNGGHRRYRVEDVEALKGLRELLHHQGFTLEGARQVIGSRGTGYLRALGRGESVPDPDTVLAGHAIACLSTEQQQDLSRALADPDACRVLAAVASRYLAGADQVGHHHG